MSSRFTATPTGRSLGDHVCWPFHGVDDLVNAARGYVREGVDRNEQVSFCKITVTGMQLAVISDVAQVGRPVDADLPVLVPLVAEPAWTPSTSPVVPFGRMTSAAVSGGYAGLRVFTDVTELVRDGEGRRLWRRGEHLLDRYTSAHPLAVLCGYDVDHLGEELVAELARLHALTGPSPCSFLLRAADPDGGLALSGEVDRESAAGLYDSVVACATDVPGPVALDLSEVTYLDHTGLMALDRAARALGTRIRLDHPSPMTTWLLDVLDLTAVDLSGAS